MKTRAIPTALPKLFLLLAMSLALTACEKFDIESGTIYDFGDPAVDGCGWVIEINQIIYKPTDLPMAYQVDELEVEIKYAVLKEWASCGRVADAFSQVELRKIDLP
ncbi:MAG: hypothetical protein HQ500_02950 [Flavobacteriales bacterium]|nr:hypothetical protein [Flavobacteriales bacterium]